VIHPHLAPTRWKETTDDLLRRADVVVINRPADDGRSPASEVVAAITRHRRDFLLADVTQPLRDWLPEWAASIGRMQVDKK